MLALALMVNLAGALAVAITVFVDAGFWWLVASLFVMVSSVSMVFPVASALAMMDYRTGRGCVLAPSGWPSTSPGLSLRRLSAWPEKVTIPLGIVVLAASASASTVFVTLVMPAVRARARSDHRGPSASDVSGG